MLVLLSHLLICLLIIAIPNLLFCWTAIVIYRRASIRNGQVLLALNIVLFISIAILDLMEVESTFGEVADFSYSLLLTYGVWIVAICFYRIAMVYYGVISLESDEVEVHQQSH